MTPEIMTSEMEDLTFTTVYSDTAMVFTFAIEIDGVATPEKMLRVAAAMESVVEAIRREVGAGHA